ncbi:hypothetical protein PMA4326_000280 [Pseudomonas syringae pv. maculicola str. ES4326]|uniref:HNH nuclease domain-containing protein n=1 Tax=Pseudomonas syringae pv. maculicola str. ES4326 TaxID=629265 RepID=A0A8T8C9X9_PSEYM|nr:hypothetical protein PMA4326_000280 [Pseudomonas syringae pv. maculicola str. ES4326]
MHLDQEAFTAGLFAFASIFGVGEGHLFHLGSTLHFSGLAYFSRFGSLFQSFPKVRKAVIDRCGARCERPGCGASRPYTGFLDVHHILGVEVSDRVSNCVALCPNCHRDAHFSESRDSLNESLLRVAQLRR